MEIRFLDITVISDRVFEAGKLFDLEFNDSITAIHFLINF